MATVEVTAASIADDEEVLTADSTAILEKLIHTISGEEIIVLVNSLIDSGNANGRGHTWARIFAAAKKEDSDFFTDRFHGCKKPATAACLKNRRLLSGVL